MVHKWNRYIDFSPPQTWYFMLNLTFASFEHMHPFKSRDTDLFFLWKRNCDVWFCGIWLFLSHMGCNSVRNVGCRNPKGHDNNIEEILEWVKAIWGETWTWVNNVLLVQQISKEAYHISDFWNNASALSCAGRPNLENCPALALHSNKDVNHLEEIQRRMSRTSKEPEDLLSWRNLDGSWKISPREEPFTNIMTYCKDR